MDSPGKEKTARTERTTRNLWCPEVYYESATLRPARSTRIIISPSIISILNDRKRITLLCIARLAIEWQVAIARADHDA